MQPGEVGIVVSDDGDFLMTNEQVNDDLQGPALYMLWPNQHPLPEVPSSPPAYRICVVASERVDQARSMVEADGVMTDREWRRYCDSLVPDGLLDRDSSEWVGCIGAVVAANSGAGRPKTAGLESWKVMAIVWNHWSFCPTTTGSETQMITFPSALSKGFFQVADQQSDNS